MNKFNYWFMVIGLWLLVLLLITTNSSLITVYAADSVLIDEPDIGIPANTALGTILGNIITIIFSVGAVGTLFYFLWGALEWIFSGGDKEKVASARKRMTHALIGLALLALAFFITRFVGQTVNIDPTGELNIPKLSD